MSSRRNSREGKNGSKTAGYLFRNQDYCKRAASNLVFITHKLPDAGKRPPLSHLLPFAASSDRNSFFWEELTLPQRESCCSYTALPSPDPHISAQKMEIGSVFTNPPAPSHSASTSVPEPGLCCLQAHLLLLLFLTSSLNAPFRISLAIVLGTAKSI